MFTPKKIPMGNFKKKNEIKSVATYPGTIKISCGAGAGPTGGLVFGEFARRVRCRRRRRGASHSGFLDDSVSAK